MPLAGKVLQPRDIVDQVASAFPTARVQATATALGESAGYIGAWHDNTDGQVLTSRDCGLMQINIPAQDIGTSHEDSLRTESLDESVYLPVVKHNVEIALELYNTPMVRIRPDGTRYTDKRRWQPWVAYTSGWAMFPEWYTWHQDASGNPVGPWLATGRYVQRAIRAVANWHLLIKKDMDSDEALAEAKRLAKLFKVTAGELRYNDRNKVYWVAPPAPTNPPADGVGPRPISNDGLWS
jgi:hypothetical protein